MTSLFRALQLGSRMGSRIGRLAPVVSRSSRMTAATSRQLQSAARLFRSEPAVLVQSTARRNDSTTSRNDHLEQSLFFMDTQLRRTGRVVLNDFNIAFDLAKKQGHVSGSPLIQLLRATGVFMREKSPTERQALTEAVWQGAERSQCDVSHYNALLQARIENDCNFDPLEVLKELKEANIRPNRVTYQRLVHQFCKNGDIAGATKVLEFMKSENIAVTERVFNSLIVGNLVLKDEASARKILDVMNNAQLAPSAETFTVLAEGLAQMGKTAEAIQAISEQSISDEQALRVVKAIAIHGSAEKKLSLSDDIRSALSKLPHCPGFTHDLVNTCFELLALGHLDASLVVANEVPFDETHSFGQFFIEQMVRSRFAPSDVARICKQWSIEGRTDLGFKKAVEAAFRHCKSGEIIEYLKFLQSSGEPIRQHYFYSAICKCSNESEVFGVLKEMSQMGVQMTVRGFSDFVLDRVNWAEPNDLLKHTHDAGCELSVPVNSIASQLLRKGKIDECINFLERNNCNRLNSSVLASHAGRIAKEDNLGKCIQLLKLCDRNRRDRDDPVGEFLRSVPLTIVSDAVSELATDKLPVTDSGITHLRKLGISEKKIDQLTRVFKHENATGLPRPSEMTTEELESHLVELESKGMNTRGVLRKLLLAFCRDKNMEKAEQILAKMTEDQLSPSCYASIIELYVSNGNLEASLETYAKLSQYEDFVLDDFKVIRLASLLVKNQKLEDACKILDEHKFNGPYEGNVNRASEFIKAAVAHYGIPEAVKLLENYVVKFSPITVNILQPILKKELEISPDAALKRMEEFNKSYGRLTPGKREICIELMQNKNEAGLNKLVEISTSAHGQNNTLADLAGCYIEVGDLQKAKECMTKVDHMRARKKVDYLLQSFLDRNLILELENLVNILREFDYQPDYLYYYSIRGCGISGDLDKAVELWTKAQEESVALSQRTLLYLSQLLERNGRPVPFVVSQIDTSDDLENAMDTSLGEALNYRRELMDKGASLSPLKEYKLVSSLLDADRIDEACEITCEMAQRDSASSFNMKCATDVLKKLASLSMIDKIEALRQNLSGHVLPELNFDAFTFQAYAKAGRAPEYLAMIEQWPAEQRLPLGPFSQLVREHPEELQRCLKIAKRCLTDGDNQAPMMTLWETLFCAGNYAEADKILAEFPEFKKDVVIARVVRLIRQTNNVDMSGRLMEIVSDHNLEVIRNRGTFVHIEALLRAERFDDAYQTLQKACQNGLKMSLLPERLMEDLKRQLVLNGKDEGLLSETAMAN